MHNAENGQPYFENLAVFTPQDFQSMFWPIFNIMHERTNPFVLNLSITCYFVVSKKRTLRGIHNVKKLTLKTDMKRLTLKS